MSKTMAVLPLCFFLSAALLLASQQGSSAEEANTAVTGPAAGQTTSPAAEATPCTRAMLREAVDGYIAAQESGDPSKMELAPAAEYFENMSEITQDEGLWSTALPIAFHRSIYDVGRCKTFSEVIVTEGGHPYVIGTRLAVDGGEVTRIDSLVTDEDDWLFNAEDYLKYSKAEDWAPLRVDDRVSRQQLVDAANRYFDFVFLDAGIRPPWGAPCARLEGGAYTNADNKDEDTCQIPAPLGELFIVNRTFLVDEELGAVNVFCRFGDSTSGMPDSHTFRLVNGRYRWVHTLSVNLTGRPLAMPDDVSGEEGS
jgi:hypothetical protein